ncbi:hypothetical protein C1O63_0269 [Dehalococcoides mccartyi]|nr:hypothetical protein C1O63_0269 [Dehalococcoides mccartyi]
MRCKGIISILVWREIFAGRVQVNLPALWYNFLWFILGLAYKLEAD